MSTPLRERPDAPLGTLIFRAGLLPAETIESALEEGVKTGKRLGEILTERGLLKEADLARLLAGQRGLEFVTLREQIVDPAAAGLFSEDQARLFRALPYTFEEGAPVVAIADPTDDVLTRNVREALGREDARFVVSVRSELAEIIEHVYTSGGASSPAPAPEPEAAAEPRFVSEPVAGQELQAPEPVAEAPGPMTEAFQQAPEQQPPAEASAPQPASQEVPAGEQPGAAFQDQVPYEHAFPEQPAHQNGWSVPEQAQDGGETHAAAPAPPPEPVPAPEPVVAPEPAAAPPAPVEPSLEAPQSFQVPVAEEPVLQAASEQQPAPADVPPEPVAPAAVTAPDPAPPAALAPAPEPTTETESYQVAVRLTNGERVETGAYPNLETAKQQAKALMAQVAAADPGDWPFVSGRFLKPDTIVSVDIL